MGTAWDITREIERKSMIDLMPIIKDAAFEGRFVITEAGRNAQLIQKTLGDVLLNANGDRKSVV